MHITFIQPAVGRKPGSKTYPKTWIMEPLSIAMLSALTPSAWRRTFFDDRLNEIDYAIETAIVCISVECYTARRAYQIAARFRARGIPVALGGFHATLMPEEAAQHADTVLCGEAENYWGEFLNDVENKSLKPRYFSDEPVALTGRFADRSIFGTRNYGPLNLVESSRGCRFVCEFCSITKFFRQTYNPRPIDDVVAEIATLKKKFIFFVDDNLAMDVDRLKALCRAIRPLRKRWIAQLSIHASHDDELLTLMRESGCAGVLIGFESLSAKTLSAMGKDVNRADHTDFSTAIARLRRHHLSIYATFVFGYDHDTLETFTETERFARDNKFFFAAFNHLVPFPGTDVYTRLKAENRLICDSWWLDPRFSFGDVVFTPKHFTAEALSERCRDSRRRFYSLPSIFSRIDFRANAHDPIKALIYFSANLSQQREVERRWKLPFGDPE